MRKLLPRLLIALFGFSMLAGVAAEQQLGQELDRVQTEWTAILNAPTTAQEKHEAFRHLAQKADSLAAQHPKKLEPRLWEAVITTSQAKVNGDPQAAETLNVLLEQLQREGAKDRG